MYKSDSILSLSLKEIKLNKSKIVNEDAQSTVAG